MYRCTQCEKTLPESAFSRNQIKKGGQRCNGCLTAAFVVRSPDEANRQSSKHAEKVGGKKRECKEPGDQPTKRTKESKDLGDQQTKRAKSDARDDNAPVERSAGGDKHFSYDPAQGVPLQELVVGQRYPGKIVNVTQIGVYVRLHGVRREGSDAFCHVSMSSCVALRSMRLISWSSLVPFAFICVRTSSPERLTTPTSNPWSASSTTTSPTCTSMVEGLRKNPFRLALNRTSTTSNGR